MRWSSSLQVLAITMLVALSAGQAVAKDQTVAFHFYGAKDCPPCMAFKRDGLPVVEAAAAKLGFKVSANVIDRTADVATPGSFGPADELLRQAAPQLEWVYPPIFLVTKNGTVVSAHRADWQKALTNAKQMAAADPA